jgi:hypothetical protein
VASVNCKKRKITFYDNVFFIHTNCIIGHGSSENNYKLLIRKIYTIPQIIAIFQCLKLFN